MDFSKLIEPAILTNTSTKLKLTESDLITKDLVFLDSAKEIEDLPDLVRLPGVTDFALMNGANVDNFAEVLSHEYWLRSCENIYTTDKNYSVNFVDTMANFVGNRISSNENYTSCPKDIRVTLHLNIEEAIKESVAGNLKFYKRFAPYSKDIQYYFTRLGNYPQSYVGDKLNEELTNLLNASKLKETGKTYTAFRGAKSAKLKEYEYNGHKYVWTLTTIDSNYGGAKYSDGSKAEGCEIAWCRVEPIEFVVSNYNFLPKELNPKGNGTAKFVELRTSKIINSNLVFHTNPFEKNTNLWQNSTIRGYLNSINVNNIKENGNPLYGANGGGDFTNNGFLQEAFNMGLVKEDLNVNTTEEVRIHNPYGFSFDKLNNDELLNAYINANASVFLHGTSGVGKSARVKAIDPNATRITLRPQMNPEEIDGTLDRETGEYIAPLWYRQLTEKCEKEPNKKHVLFIDELTNVKPTVQSLVYNIVLDRAGKDGLWKLPDNAVVVAAGNESEDNLAAYPLTNALFRRFSHIYYKVDKENWLNWAMEITNTKELKLNSTPKEERAKIHPAIIGYIMSREENVLNQDLDEENPNIVTDPRKWEIASNILYETKNPYALIPAIGEDLTSDFVDFVKNIQITVEDVVNNKVDTELFKNLTLSAKLSNLMGLTTAKEENVKLVRNFVGNAMGKELLATYDAMWIRNDPERAMLIKELKTEDNFETEVKAEEIKPKNSKYKITMDEFFSDSKNEEIFIYCNKQWKLNFLIKIFGKKYPTIYNEKNKATACKRIGGNSICVGNIRSYLDIETVEDRNKTYYHFNEIDLNKYLTTEEFIYIEKRLTEESIYAK